MSKAFTKEDAADSNTLLPYDPPWLPGSRNYISAAGLEKLQSEREHLLQELSARKQDASGEPGSSHDLRRRLQILTTHIEAAEVVAPLQEDPERVQFGATVRVRDGEERERTFTIVGVDETDTQAGRVSWTSPVARALSGATVGDIVTFISPRGEEELEVLAIRRA